MTIRPWLDVVASTVIVLSIDLCASTPGLAQTTRAANPYRTVNLNYVYAADLGFGGYTLDGLTA